MHRTGKIRTKLRKVVIDRPVGRCVRHPGNASNALRGRGVAARVAQAVEAALNKGIVIALAKAGVGKIAALRPLVTVAVGAAIALAGRRRCLAGAARAGRQKTDANPDTKRA